MPGIAASTSETWLLGAPPNSVEAPENSLEFEVTWAWTSIPMTTSQSPVAPLISFEGLVCTFMSRTIYRGTGSETRLSATKHKTRHQARNGETDMKIQGMIAASLLLTGAGLANAVEITVLSTQATEQACRELLPQFEKASGNTVKIVYTGTLDAKKRIAAGESFDVLVMASNDIDDFLASGVLAPGSRVDIAKSGVGIGVKAGAPKPDISTTE